MIDSELVNGLDEASLQIGGIMKLPPNAADAYVHRIAESYVADPLSLRWWESLKVCAKRVSYGDADGLSKVDELLGSRREAMLVVTDDEEPPWLVYSGDVQKIIAVLGEVRFFEYILAAPDMSWVVFDTHMNELVIAGLNEERMRE